MLDETNMLLKPRRQIFGLEKNASRRKKIFIFSVDKYLLEAGNCGVFTNVLARILTKAGFKVRIAQIYNVEEKGASHILLEVMINETWVLLDPFFNLAFKNKDGSLASLSEIKNNWSNYTQQLPLQYRKDLRYDKPYRYTNWNKYPFLPYFKQLIAFATGQDPEYISLAMYYLNSYKICFIFTLICILVLIFITILFMLVSGTKNRIGV